MEFVAVSSAGEAHGSASGAADGIHIEQYIIECLIVGETKPDPAILDKLAAAAAQVKTEPMYEAPFKNLEQKESTVQVEGGLTKGLETTSSSTSSEEEDSESDDDSVVRNESMYYRELFRGMYRGGTMQAARRSI